MKKFTLIAIALLTFTFTFAQEKVKDTSYWAKSGKITLLINQSSFSNWQSGGDNSFAGNLDINYGFNYAKGVWSWDNKLIAAYGLTKTQDDGVRKTDDRFEFNSVVGRKLTDTWSASFFLNLKTQFSNGYDYEDDFIGDNEDYPTSGFFKPGYLSFGPGFLWKKSDNFSINFAPITSKITFLTSEIYSYNEDTDSYDSSNDIETFGVAPGDAILYEFGFNARGYYKFNIMENVSMENILTLFSNYLDKPQNIDLDYTMNLDMKINSFLSAKLVFQTIYDDNAYKGFQIREVFGLGLNYGF